MAISGIGTGVQINTSTPTKAEKLALQLLDDKVSVDSSDISALEKESESPDYPEGVTHKRFFEKVESALDGALELRKEQVAITERAQETASPEYRSELQTEAGNLDTEVSRIFSAGSYNGKSVSEAGTFSIIDQNKDNYQVTSNAQVTSIITGAVGISTSTITLSETSETNTRNVLKLTSLFRSDTEGRIEESEDNLVLKEEVDQVEVRSSSRTLTSFDEAKQAADTVRDQILKLAFEGNEGGAELAFHKQDLDAGKIFLLLDGS